MKIRSLLTLFLAGMCLSITAQSILPKGMTVEERDMIPGYIQKKSVSGITSPPPGPVRTAAEWEEIQALTITWAGFQDILIEIVRNAVEEVEVIIFCNNSNSVLNTLANNGVNTSKVRCVEEDFNSIWIRDYGANTVYLNDVDSLILVDWIYNRPRPDDDAIPERLGQELGLDVYTTTEAPYGVVHTGGNFMMDGMGKAFSSELVLDENGPQGDFNPATLNEAQITSILGDFMGIEEYVLMETLPYDLIHHIDMHMKLLDEETLLVGEYPQGTADGPQIEANIQYVINNFTTSYGTPYKVVRIPMPPDFEGEFPNAPWGDYRTYSNNVFINKTVLVPVYEEKYDTTGLRILRENLPGYNVVGIECNDIIQYSGAIHCITHSVGVNDPMWITHQKLQNTEDEINDYAVNAKIKHRSGIASATLHYKTSLSGSYIAVSMSETNAGESIWSADIPAQSAGTVIYYYIEGTSNSGKQQVRPLTAPDGYFKFKVLSNLVYTADPTIDGNKMQEVFPNPAAAMTCIPVESSKTGFGTIELMNIHGQKMETIHSGKLPVGISRYFFNAAQYPAGTYFVVMQNEDIRQTKKIIIH